MVEPAPSPGAPRASEQMQVEVLRLFPTPIVVATIPNALALNTELRRIILARESANESVERSNRGGWQSSSDMHEWGGAPIQRVLAYARAVVDDATVDRAGQHHKIAWRIDCWANVSRIGHGNQVHTHPGALWSANYYVDDGGIAANPSLGGEFEMLDPRGVAPVMYAPQLTFPGPDFVAVGEAQRLAPRAGVFIVFPSWLSHGVCSYRGNGERISIAINFSIAAHGGRSE
jgi:uncharacterized protein (TIGR02466 family)